MNANLLIVNDDKTIALVLASRNHQKNHSITTIKIGDCVPTLPTPVLCLMPTCPRLVMCNMYAAPHITNCGTLLP